MSVFCFVLIFFLTEKLMLVIKIFWVCVAQQIYGVILSARKIMNT